MLKPAPKRNVKACSGYKQISKCAPRVQDMQKNDAVKAAADVEQDDVTSQFLNIIIKSPSRDSDLLVEKGSYEDVDVT